MVLQASEMEKLKSKDGRQKAFKRRGTCFVEGLEALDEGRLAFRGPERKAAAVTGPQHSAMTVKGTMPAEISEAVVASTSGTLSPDSTSLPLQRKAGEPPKAPECLRLGHGRLCAVVPAAPLPVPRRT